MMNVYYSRIQRPSTPCDEDCHLPRIPTGTRVTEFIGEGSANVVVRIELPPTAPATTRAIFAGKLLRLQKASRGNENRPYPYVTQHEHFRSRIQPLFPHADDLVSHELVALGGPGIIDQVHGLLDVMDKMSDPFLARNQAPPTPEMLNEASGHIHWDCLPMEWQDKLGAGKIKKRKKQFIGSQLAFVDFGLLVEDMSIGPNQDGILIEIKPKWLLQSASAPRTSTRCRNCAIELHRSRRGHSKQTRPKPCPLLLLSDDFRHRRDFMSQLLITVEPDEWFVAPLLTWAGGVPGSRPNRLLLHLRALQERLDRDGPLKAAQATKEEKGDFPLAMTMRDCSVFIKVVRRAESEECVVTAKVGDLDMKNADAKMPYWERTERELLSCAYTDEDCQLQHPCGLRFSS